MLKREVLSPNLSSWSNPSSSKPLQCQSPTTRKATPVLTTPQASPQRVFPSLPAEIRPTRPASPAVPAQVVVPPVVVVDPPAAATLPTVAVVVADHLQAHQVAEEAMAEEEEAAVEDLLDHPVPLAPLDPVDLAFPFPFLSQVDIMIQIYWHN